jgi:SAM-dependent methyltransferase
MSQPVATLERREPLDPFAMPTPGRVPPRPRLLSFVGRWGRARRWLPAGAMRVLDVGCASGYGSAAIAARGPAGRTVIGVEPDSQLAETARTRFPWLEMISADASELPFPDDCADAMLLLDVIEHVEAPEQVLGEAARVLRQGGTLIVTVPHKGLTRHLDALNIYESLRRTRPSLPPHDEGLLATEDGEHRHFTADELAEMFGAQFTIEEIARTGLGLQELVHLAMLALNVRGAQRISRLLAPLHLITYILDDMVPTGPCAYHLAVRARKNGAGASPAAGTSKDGADLTAREPARSAERT